MYTLLNYQKGIYVMLILDTIFLFYFYFVQVYVTFKIICAVELDHVQIRCQSSIFGVCGCAHHTNAFSTKDIKHIFSCSVLDYRYINKKKQPKTLSKEGRQHHYNSIACMFSSRLCKPNKTST
jgi:hypothetical protein